MQTFVYIGVVPEHFGKRSCCALVLFLVGDHVLHSRTHSQKSVRYSISYTQ